MASTQQNRMTAIIDTNQPADIRLLLRAYAEQRWLTNNLLPHLRVLEGPHAISDEDLAAPLAYLEVLWLDARGRAAETDAAFADLDPLVSGRCRVLQERARRYYLAVRKLRAGCRARVTWLTQPELPGYHAACA